MRTGPLLLVASLLRAGTCAPDTLANYELLPAAGCTVNGLSFSGFMFSSTATGTGVAVPASSIMVSPTTTNGEQGLMFSSGGWSVGAMGKVVYVITYTEDPSGDIRSMDDVLDDPVVVPGIGRVDTLGCLGAAFSGGICSMSTVSVSVFDDGIAPVKMASTNFAGVHILGIQQTVTLASSTSGTGLGSGSASITDFGGQSFVPEPSTVWLAAASVLALVLARQTRLKRL
jgi:hypothetical protein